MVPESFQLVAKMVKNRGLEGVWCCFVACLRPKAPVGRFLDSSWAALGASWAPVGWLLGRLGRQAGAFKGVLEAAWRRLGGKLMRKWSQVGINVE